MVVWFALFLAAIYECDSRRGSSPRAIKTNDASLDIESIFEGEL